MLNEEYYQMYLEELKEIKPGTDQERAKLLPRAAFDEAARGRLIEGHLIFALAVAKDFRDQGLPMSDLVQEANLALTMAVSEYRAGDFLGFVKKRIEDSLVSLLNQQKQLSQSDEEIVARVNVLQTVSRVLYEELGREATLPELAAKMQMPPDEVKEIMRMAMAALNHMPAADSGAEAKG